MTGRLLPIAFLLSDALAAEQSESPAPTGKLINVGGYRVFHSVEIDRLDIVICAITQALSSVS